MAQRPALGLKYLVWGPKHGLEAKASTRGKYWEDQSLRNLPPNTDRCAPGENNWGPTEILSLGTRDKRLRVFPTNHSIRNHTFSAISILLNISVNRAKWQNFKAKLM